MASKRTLCRIREVCTSLNTKTPFNGIVLPPVAIEGGTVPSTTPLTPYVFQSVGEGGGWGWGWYYSEPFVTRPHPGRVGSPENNPFNSFVRTPVFIAVNSWQYADKGFTPRGRNDAGNCRGSKKRNSRGTIRERNERKD